MAKSDKIEDFGKKIDGARKDLYSLDRMLRGEDISNWTDAEKAAYVTKKTIFPKPDYAKMIADGVPREAAYYIKCVYNALPVRPAQKSEEGQKGYVDFLAYFREKLENIKTVSDAANFRENCINKSPFLTETATHSLRVTAEAYGCMSNKLYRAAYYDPRTIKRGIAKEQFGYSETEKLTDGYVFVKYNGLNAELDRDGYRDCLKLGISGSTYFLYNLNEKSDPDKWQKDTWLAINPKREIVEINFPSQDELIKHIAEIEREKQKDQPKKTSTPKKKSLIPQPLDNIERIGEDYLKGREIKGEEMLYIFGIRGGQYGNWESDLLRRQNNVMTYNAFADYAQCLKIANEDIGLDGKKPNTDATHDKGLAIAWGARGHGNAMAHYELAENVINLTKFKGAGSLAHEMGHALDAYIAKCTKSGASFETERAWQQTSPLHEVMEAIKYVDNGDGTKRESDFYTNARKIDKNHSTSGNQKGQDGSGYWSSSIELFARAYATYVMDKLKENDLKNDYLCGHAEMVTLGATLNGQDGKFETLFCYPRGDERKNINAAFDKLFDKMKERGYLHHRTALDDYKLSYGIELNQQKLAEAEKAKTEPKKLIHETYHEDGSTTVQEPVKNPPEKEKTSGEISHVGYTPPKEPDFAPIPKDAEFVQISLFDFDYQKYIAQEATRETPELFGIQNGIICQQVNCQGAYGAGLSGVISDKFPEVETAYRSVCKEYKSNGNTENLLGKHQLIDLSENGELMVANLFTQKDYGNSLKTGVVYTDLDKLIDAIEVIAASNEDKEVYLPHHVDEKNNHTGIGCGLAGEKWEHIQERLEALNLPNISLIDTYTGEKEKVPYKAPQKAAERGTPTVKKNQDTYDT